MAKKDKHSKKYYEVLKLFQLTPDFKLDDFEKDVVKFIDKVGMVTVFGVADQFDLKPSKAKDLIASLSDKNVIVVESGNVKLSEAAYKYLHASKEERKTEKKFRKFLDALDEKDLDSFMTLVNSFDMKDIVKETKKVVKDVKPDAKKVEDVVVKEAKKVEDVIKNVQPKKEDVKKVIKDVKKVKKVVKAVEPVAKVLVAKAVAKKVKTEKAAAKEKENKQEK